MKKMSIRLPDELYAKLEAQAEKVGVAPAVLARVYLKDLVEKRDRREKNQELDE